MKIPAFLLTALLPLLGLGVPLAPGATDSFRFAETLARPQLGDASGDRGRLAVVAHLGLDGADLARTVAGTGTLGATDGAGDVATFLHGGVDPMAVAVGGTGALYVSGTSSVRLIQRIINTAAP